MQANRNSWDTLTAVAFVGSYLPRRCGIATFTADLAEAVASVNPDLDTWAVALNDRPEGYRYPPRVWFEINQNRFGEYRLAADFLNMSNVDVCCLQHEYGLFGGKAGQHIIEFLRRLRMPVVATLHTVLSEPTPSQLDVTRQLAEVCDRLVVMAARAYDFLENIYRIPREKVTLIHHGIPDVPFVDPNYFKDQFGVEGKKVIMTFGLLSPNKGIENMIDALPRVIDRHPDVVYIVLGATHPGVMAVSGEDYRLGLKRRARDLGVDQNIEWVNKFVENDQLVEYLGAADVYITPYHNEAQITSGTLAYAMGTGKATISTPYWYAQEMLGDGRGRLVPFKDPDALAATIIDLFGHETERHAMRKRAYQFTRQMRWHEIAGQYLGLFGAVREERNRYPKPAVASRATKGKKPEHELVEIKIDHLQMLTDDVGVFRFAKATIPDRAHGYTVDDTAKSLIVALLADEHLERAAGPNLDSLVSRYLSFLDHAFDDQTRRFRNALGFDRRWCDPVDTEEFQLDLEDTHGRAIWALGEAVARCQRRGHMTLATNLFQRALPACEGFEHPHAWAFSLIGIHAYLRRFSGDSGARRAREHLANRLFDRFRANSSDDWPWLMDTLTYANARFPHALLLSGRWLFRDEMIQAALRSLEWLHEMQTGPNGQFAPVGDQGWFPRGGQKARFDQKPMEAAATIDASLEAYRVTADRKWIDRAYHCLNWFLGDNDLHTPLYDHTTGGCHDCLAAHGVNKNQGAEATLGWLLSLLGLYDLARDEEGGPAVDAAVEPIHPVAVDAAVEPIDPVAVEEPVPEITVRPKRSRSRRVIRPAGDGAAVSST